MRIIVEWQSIVQNIILEMKKNDSVEKKSFLRSKMQNN